MTKRMKLAYGIVEATAEEGVERDATGIPTAFRIWRAGRNTFDGGELFFTPDSAAALMAEQTQRARPYSIDFDHLSLAENRPAEAGRASGYHALEVRDGELWAAQVEWCPDVREGLAEKPPRWRYFSPAFKHSDDYEITSYINLALCINPLTHGIPLLASHKATTNASRNERDIPMTAEEELAALDAMIEAEKNDTVKEHLVAARKALADATGSDGSSDGGETASHADGEKKDPPPSDGDDDEKKKAAATAAHATAAHAAGNDAVTNLAKEVLALRRDVELRDIDAELAKYPTLPTEFAKHCRSKSLADAKVSIAAVVGAKTHAARKATPSQGGAATATSGLDPREEDALDRAMGVKSPTATLPFKRDDGTFVMHNIRPADLQRLKAQKGAA